MIKSKVCIVGAGPAGSMAALFLAKHGIDSILADKARFPRDKICGDGISGWVVSILEKLDPELLRKLSVQPFVLPSYGLRIYAPNSNYLELPFVDGNHTDPQIAPGYIGRRLHFDNFLIEEIRKKKEITLLENTEIVDVKIHPDGAELTSQTENKIKAEVIIFANGANSVFMNNPGGIIRTKKNTMTGLKVYYEGVTGFHRNNYVELHFLKEIIPGYFWIFPLPEGLANVGIGIDQHRISKNKLNLKDIMLRAIEGTPYIAERFRNARMISKIQAFSIPVWDGHNKISGERFMLAGDAASLVDPATGEGVGHAVISGMFAAKQAVRSLETGNFSAKFMEGYDKSVYDKIGKELNISSKITRFIRYPWLFNAMVNRASKSKTLQERLTLAMTDLEVRKRLKEPSMYFKVLLGR
jgi:geranylgeranyl reductase family protein